VPLHSKARRESVDKRDDPRVWVACRVTTATLRRPKEVHLRRGLQVQALGALGMHGKYGLVTYEGCVLRHDGRMHLTSDELTLGVAAIAAAAGWGSAVVTSRAGRRQDHMSRLWERRAEVYELVVALADSWRSARAETIRLIGHGEIDAVAPEPIADDAEWRRSWARLEMYGERRVRQAFERYGQADKKFVIAFIGWRAAADRNLKADRGEIPVHEAVAGEELVRLRKAVESARDHADAEQEKFVATVAQATGRLPRYERRAWRRLKQPPAN
jgi:hypothetical protein